MNKLAFLLGSILVATSSSSIFGQDVDTFVCADATSDNDVVLLFEVAQGRVVASDVRLGAPSNALDEGSAVVCGADGKFIKSKPFSLFNQIGDIDFAEYQNKFPRTNHCVKVRTEPYNLIKFDRTRFSQACYGPLAEFVGVDEKNIIFSEHEGQLLEKDPPIDAVWRNVSLKITARFTHPENQTAYLVEAECEATGGGEGKVTRVSDNTLMSDLISPPFPGYPQGLTNPYTGETRDNDGRLIEDSKIVSSARSCGGKVFGDGSLLGIYSGYVPDYLEQLPNEN